MRELVRLERDWNLGIDFNQFIYRRRMKKSDLPADEAKRQSQELINYSSNQIKLFFHSIKPALIQSYFISAQQRGLKSDLILFIAGFDWKKRFNLFDCWPGWVEKWVGWLVSCNLISFLLMDSMNWMKEMKRKQMKPIKPISFQTTQFYFLFGYLAGCQTANSIAINSCSNFIHSLFSLNVPRQDADCRSLSLNFL